jgi:hypothetical protein
MIWVLLAFVVLAAAIWLAACRLAGYRPFPVFMGKVPLKEKEALKRANKQ